MGLLRGSDRISMSRDRLLAEARARVLDLAGEYLPPQPATIAVLGDAALGNLRFQAHDWGEAGRASPHDVRVCEELATVLSGGPGPPRELDEQDLLDREREAFLRLAGTSATRERIAHMLATGTPLRN
jgi:3-hydroxyacyl-CoA dehydrogenase